MNARFLIGSPKVLPNKLIKGLKTLFSTIPQIKAAYLAQICREPFDIPPHLLIAIDMDGDLNSISHKLNVIIEQVLAKDECIEMIPFNNKDFIGYFSKISPFYKFSQNKK